MEQTLWFMRAIPPSAIRHQQISHLSNRPCFMAYFAKNGCRLQNNQRNHWLFRLKGLFEVDPGQITSEFTGYFRWTG